jgi:hypothetical protein
VRLTARGHLRHCALFDSDQVVRDSCADGSVGALSIRHCFGSTVKVDSKTLCQVFDDKPFVVVGHPFAMVLDPNLLGEASWQM